MRPLQARGFTLVEVLVALVGLALMAGLSWRGLDSMMRTRDASQQRVDEVAVLQTALAQWRTDLDAATLLPGASDAQGVDWDGRVLRIVRRSTIRKRMAATPACGSWVGPCATTARRSGCAGNHRRCATAPACCRPGKTQRNGAKTLARPCGLRKPRFFRWRGGNFSIFEATAGATPCPARVRPRVPARKAFPMASVWF